MEKELNIAAILKGKPKNIKLWCSIYGEAYLKKVYSNETINITHHGGYNVALTKNGKSWNDGECVLFPSKSMRDWRKFAWKKGDVLHYGKSTVVFERWISEQYIGFIGAHEVYGDNSYFSGSSFITKNYMKTTEENEIKNYLDNITKLTGGKLNLETLEIEKPQFKDGDIVVLDESEDSIYVKCILILKAEDKGEGVYSFYAFLNTFRGNVEFNDEANHDGKLRLATTEEKKQLFDAIAKENKAWDAEKKAIVDLPKKCEFKAFDKVLVRCKDYQKWKVDFFSHYDDSCKGFPYVCVSSRKSFCIPYTDQTAHLLGTTDGYAEGGEE